jgi:hypothetical protein
MSANAQVALEKFARYFDVECRLVPVSEESRYHLDVKKAMEHIDENTIGVFVILGSTSLCLAASSSNNGIKALTQVIMKMSKLSRSFWTIMRFGQVVRSPSMVSA